MGDCTWPKRSRSRICSGSCTLCSRLSKARKCKLHKRAGMSREAALLPPLLSLTRHCQQTEWEGRRRPTCTCVCVRVGLHVEKVGGGGQCARGRSGRILARGRVYGGRGSSRRTRHQRVETQKDNPASHFYCQ